MNKINKIIQIEAVMIEEGRSMLHGLSEDGKLYYFNEDPDRPIGWTFLANSPDVKS